MNTCSDCGKPIGQDAGPADGWQLEDGRTVCHACCGADIKRALHVNSGRMSWDFRICRFFVRLTIAEDPRKPLLLRTWARPSLDGKELEVFFFKLSRSERKFDDGECQAAWNLIFGPVTIWLALINKR